MFIYACEKRHGKGKGEYGRGRVWEEEYIGKNRAKRNGGFRLAFDGNIHNK